MSRRPRRPRNTRGPKRPMFKLSFNYSGGGGFDPACREPCICAEEEPRALSMAEIETKRSSGQVLSIDDMLAFAQFNDDPLNAALGEKNTADASPQSPVEALSEYKEQAWYEYNIAPSNHKYTHLSVPICKAETEGCNFSDIVDALNKKGVHPEQTQPFVPGKDYFADVDIHGPWGPDPIETTAISDPSTGVQIGVQNTTLEGHILHPGVIKRTVVLVDGWYHILTDGYGSGPFGGPNVWLRDWVWSNINEDVIKQLQQK